MDLYVERLTGTLFPMFLINTGAWHLGKALIVPTAAPLSLPLLRL